MKKKYLLVFILVLLMAIALNGWRMKDYKTYKTETLKKELSFTHPNKSATFEIDNIFGFIHLEGYQGKTVQISMVKTIRAKSKAEADKAEREVILDISNDETGIRYYVDGPFRDQERKVNWRQDEIGYIVQYDFTVKVPKNINVKLKTVTNGKILVKDIHGESRIRNVNNIVSVSNIIGNFDIKTVNGGISMEQILGSGKAHTVNGSVEVDFVKNPRETCSFYTINGKLNINFKKGLSADFMMKTFNGKMYSDFPSTLLPTKPGKGVKKNGRYIYKSSGFQSVRIGSGGPTIKLDTFNGNIYINQGE